MEKPCCATCAFGQNKMQVSNEIRMVRTCQRFPPTVLVLPGNVAFVNPAVSDPHWCGEFVEMSPAGDPN